MREITLRAWDVTYKQMLKINDAKFVDGLLIGVKGINWDSKVVVMQYTGLKDRNGCEIYEDDVVRGEFIAYDIGVCTGQILFDEARFIFKSDSQPNYPNTPVWVPLCEMKNVEIIGNVHQHPHLLGG